MNRNLLITAGVVLVLALFVYWWVYGPFFSSKRSPEALMQTALTGATAEERELAAVELGDYAVPADDSGNRPAQAAKAVECLVQVMRESTDPVTKSAAIEGLRRARHWDSTPALFEAMMDESSLIRGRAARAAETIIGASYDFNPEGPLEEREAKIKYMRGDYERMNARRQEMAAGGASAPGGSN